MEHPQPDWRFDDTYARQLEGFYLDWTPTAVPSPSLIALNDSLATDLGIDPAMLHTDAAIAVLAGKRVAEGSRPVAQAYAGHQFGHYSPMLGDGRAVLLGEVIDRAGRRRDLALKGSGRTQFSRGGDGKATLSAVLREYVVGEAMHALGIPTTRALAAVTTGEVVPRDAQAHPGAVLTRVAASHLRVGTFELVARNGSLEHLRLLADYAMARHFPELDDGDYAGFLSAVVAGQAELVAAWVSVGFIHGVMNTDNMTISGETIDYGPCAFLEAYGVDEVFSSIDTGGRYRYGHQPIVAAWNLARFAETLVPLLAAQSDVDVAVADATRRVEEFSELYEVARLRRFGAKLALPGHRLAPLGGDRLAPPGGDRLSPPGDDGDTELIGDLLAIMGANRLDFTLTFRRLAQVLRGERDVVRERVADVAAYDAWQQRWIARLTSHSLDAALTKPTVVTGTAVTEPVTGTAASSPSGAADAMDGVNPIYLARNHLVEAALAAAESGDLGPFERLLSAVSAPYDERAGFEAYAEPAPDGFTDTYRTFCGT